MIKTCPESVCKQDSLGFTPLHYAVQSDNPDLARILLQDGAAKTDVKGHRNKIPIHFAKSPTMVKLLIENKTNPEDPYVKKLSVKQGCGCNIKYVHREPAKTGSRKSHIVGSEYVKCKCEWNEKRELRLPDGENDTPESNDENSKCINVPKCPKVYGYETRTNDNDGKSIFTSLLKKNDAAAVAFLDEHVKTTDTDLEAHDALIVYDLKLFAQEAGVSRFDTGKDIQENFSAHKKMMNCGSKCFEHPLSKAFVALEQQCFSIFFPWLRLRDFSLVIFLTFLAWWQGKLITDETCGLNQTSNSTNETKCLFMEQTLKGLMQNNDDSLFSDLFRMDSNVNASTMMPITATTELSYKKICYYLLIVVVWINLLSIVLREFRQALWNTKRYFSDEENVVEIALIFSSLAYLIGMHYWNVTEVLHAAAWSVFFAWIEVLIVLSRVYKFGMYLIMLAHVAKRLFGYVLLFLPGLIAFAWAFHILPHVENSPFHGETSSILKVGAMMIGEIGFEDYFEWKVTKAVRSHMSSQLLLTLFLLICCIAMVNLLVGLAVNEIEKEMATAKTVQNQIAVEEIDEYWKKLDKSPLIRILRKVCCCLSVWKKEGSTDKPPTYCEKLTGPNGIFNNLVREWEATGLEKDKFTWKVCI